MAVWNCKMCGGNLVSIDAATGLGQCESCGKKQTLPNEADERRTHQFNQANHYRRCNEFDRAAQVYAKILDDDPVEAEAYWGIVLCRYGIEYVEDSKTMQRIPTCHRTLTRSILKDPDYLQALSCARPMARLQYKKEAEEIDRIQKEILMLASKEEPFDIFISYKESDDRSGQRTPDSVLAQDIYTALTKEGYKVFFSRITLEKYLGQAFEPIIYAALRSSKVMVAIGTRKEYFEAPWVRNEWNRYLGMMEETPGEKTLIPVYRDMDPYDLPEEFGHPQALNAANIGFLQDLLHGIEKLIRNSSMSGHGTSQPETYALLERAMLFLENGNYSSAAQYSQKYLDIAPKDYRGYIAALMAEAQCRTERQLGQVEIDYTENENYQNALRFAPPNKKAELEAWAQSALSLFNKKEQTKLTEQAKQKEAEAQSKQDAELWLAAANLYEQIGDINNAHRCKREAILPQDKQARESKSIVQMRSVGKAYQEAGLEANGAECFQLADHLETRIKEHAQKRSVFGTKWKRVNRNVNLLLSILTLIVVLAIVVIQFSADNLTTILINMASEDGSFLSQAYGQVIIGLAIIEVPLLIISIIATIFSPTGFEKDGFSGGCIVVIGIVEIISMIRSIPGFSNAIGIILVYMVVIIPLFLLLTFVAKVTLGRLSVVAIRYKNEKDKLVKEAQELNFKENAKSLNISYSLIEEKN